jgi:hypothetical protein
MQLRRASGPLSCAAAIDYWRHPELAHEGIIDCFIEYLAMNLPLIVISNLTARFWERCLIDKRKRSAEALKIAI